MPGEWWKNYILPQHIKEHTNVAFYNDHLNLCKAWKYDDASKW